MAKYKYIVHWDYHVLFIVSAQTSLTKPHMYEWSSSFGFDYKSNFFFKNIQFGQLYALY